MALHPRVTSPPVMVDPPGLFVQSMKDPTDIKTPQLPFNEKVSVAARAVGVQ
jgi:hypothetical protein